jgi:hypothetical protein
MRFCAEIRKGVVSLPPVFSCQDFLLQIHQPTLSIQQMPLAGNWKEDAQTQC